MVRSIRQYAAQGFTVKSLVFDGEEAIAAISDNIAERKNKVIKDCVLCFR